MGHNGLEAYCLAVARRLKWSGGYRDTVAESPFKDTPLNKRYGMCMACLKRAKWRVKTPGGWYFTCIGCWWKKWR